MEKNRSKLKQTKITDVHCNVCGKQIKSENGILTEDVFEAQKEWGYFSKRDLEIHKFNICEECYDKMIATFKIPVEVYHKHEVL